MYNESGDALYVHHDNLLPTIPICMEWLNYNPTTDKPGKPRTLLPHLRCAGLCNFSVEDQVDGLPTVLYDDFVET